MQPFEIFAEASVADVTRDWIPCHMCRHAGKVGFRPLSHDEADFMTRFKLGRELLREGELLRSDSAGKLLTVYSGYALRMYSWPNGALQPLELVWPGDFIGMELVDRKPADTVLRALTDVTYCSFDPARFDELRARPALSRRLDEILARHARRQARRLAVAQGLPAAGKACHVLVEAFDALSRRRLVRDNSFSLPLARELLAQLVGITPVHLRRVMGDLSAHRILDFKGQVVTIHDVAAARRIGCAPEESQDPLSLL